MKIFGEIFGGCLSSGKSVSTANMEYLMFNANRKEFIKSLSEKEREALISFEAEKKPDECLCCIFFKWENDEPTCSMMDEIQGFDIGKRADNCIIDFS